MTSDSAAANPSWPPLPSPQPVLKTRRLWLRAFDLADAPAVHALASDERIASTTLNIPHPYEDGMAEAWILSHRQLYVAGVVASFALVLQETRELIGAIGLHLEPRHLRAELGYWIGVPYWNQGYATEAGSTMLEFGFRVLELNRIHASHFTRNPASGAVMRKLGMSYEGSLRQHVRKNGIFEDLETYAILRSDYLKNETTHHPG